jgi:3'-phosphoadenosine 5'-phosphosulfate sulfotransferase (PAPS reductase)/FAD synthetase
MATKASSKPNGHLTARKQRSDNADWIAAWTEIRADPDHQRATRLVQEAAAAISSRVADEPRASYGWSGGKDSLALEICARAAGVHDCVLVISGLEWPAFLQWSTDNMPWGLTVECRDNLDLAWLAANPAMLFPDTPSAGRWFGLVQHSGQRAYCSRTGTSVFLQGRRWSDGNQCGKPSPSGYGHEYVDRSGFTRYSPLSEWSHTDVLHVLASHRIELPPCYSWPRGFRVGTGPWPARQWTASVADGWREVIEIDPSVAEMAAHHNLPGARQALRGVPSAV